MDALDHFDKLYGDLGLSPQDAAIRARSNT